MKSFGSIASLSKRIFTFSPWLLFVTAYAAVVAQLLIFRVLIRDINPWLTILPVSTAGDAALLLIPFVWLTPRWRKAIWLMIGGMTVFCYVNLWYCRAFYDLMPFDSLGMGGNMQTRVIEAFFDQLRAADWFLLLPPLAFGTIWRFALRDARKLSFPLTAKICITAGSLILYGSAYMVRCYNLYSVNKHLGNYAHMLCNYPRYSKANAYKFTQHLTRMGYCGYMLWQLNEAFGDKSLSEAERRRVDRFWQQKRNQPRLASDFSSNRQKNLIFIIVESLASDAVGANIGGMDVAPVLNSLAADSGSIVFSRMQAQVNHGRSSDGQFIYNTGLLPLRQNVVAKRYPSANYPSIAKALAYKNSSEVVGEKPTFYNHSITNVSYGYTGFVPAVDEWLSDQQIFANALKEMSHLKQPFYCEITTLDMHDPYNHGVEKPTAISRAEGFDTRDLNYMEQVHKFDTLLGNFIDSLKQQGIYDNSVIVVASDHEPRKNALSDTGLISSDIFLLILNSGIKNGIHSQRIVGQIDVMPTILDVMGVTNYKFPGLGHSLVAEPEHHGAIDAFGNLYGAPDSIKHRQLEEAWNVSALMIQGAYFK